MSNINSKSTPPGMEPSDSIPQPNVSRKAPPDISPVTSGDTRYEQVINAELLGKDQRTGFLAAYDKQTDERLWILKIYDTQQIENLESDVQDVFFKSMILLPDGNNISITNERNETYLVELKTKKVTKK
ncbi:hypothetical protein DI392_07840 [Vibrio albus]|uniref:Uncharacterized protein n=1 Tax=Vibrio albus TaxID=2200953 RepID=A0A2U3BBJ1_9VIBR|nr:hypothetical protein [Vibrio albus]PWI34094.1 hypothetical protein DI392_07840 [Vibrio albus]